MTTAGASGAVIASHCWALGGNVAPIAAARSAGVAKVRGSVTVDLVVEVVMVRSPTPRP